MNHRWQENETVCERALELWEDILKYVKAAESKEITKPGRESYETVVEASKDKLIRVKLQFFKCVAGQIQPFLAFFQSDKPLTLWNQNTLKSCENFNGKITTFSCNFNRFFMV